MFFDKVESPHKADLGRDNPDIMGTPFPDKLHGTPLADIIRGLADYDDLYGGNGNDRLYGGEGDDNLYGGRGNDLLVGGDGWDYLFPNSGRDTLMGGGGNDDYFIGLEGRHSLVKENANSGIDAVHVDGFSYTLGKNVEYLYQHADKGSYRLGGNNLGNFIGGGGGSDVLYGRQGADTLIGAQGSDTMVGGSGNDVYDFFVEDLENGKIDRDVVSDSGGELDVLALDQVGFSALSAVDVFKANGAKGHDGNFDSLRVLLNDGDTITVWHYFDNSSADIETVGAGRGLIEIIAYDGGYFDFDGLIDALVP